MRIETNFFIIESDKIIPNINEIIVFLDKRVEEILDFFEITSPKKKQIIFWNNIDEYIKHLSKYTEYQDGMCADTFDKKINVLSLEENHKTKTHAYMTEKAFRENIAHEYVHTCQQDLETEESKTNSWFYEALATNLGNSEQFGKLYKIEVTREELENFNKIENNRYEIAYTIGRYILENYSKEEILEFVKYPSLLNIETDKILSGAKRWVQEVKENTK